MTHAEKALLDPYARQLADMEKSLENMADDDLKGLERACASASKTNCWVYTFRAAQVLLPMIRSIKHCRGMPR